MFIIAAIIICSTRATAQTNDSTILDEVVVTANRIEQKQDQTGKVLTVITRAVLEKNSGRNMGEILNQFAGFTVVGANNNPGTNLDVYTRGAGLGNTLILINGTPVYDVSSISSAFDLNFITADMVERIEVLKGGQSTIYGSDAVAGVINIITRKPPKKRVSFDANVAAGSFGTLKSGIGLRGSVKDLSYGLQYQYLRTSGLSAALDSSGKGDFDKDGLQQHNVLGSLNGKFNERFSWRLMGQANLYKADLDANAYNDDKDHTVKNKNYTAALGLDYRLGNTAIHGNYTLNTTARDYLDDSTDIGGFAQYSQSSFKGLSHFAELYANIKLGDRVSLLAGTDLRRQQTDQYALSISSFGPYETSIGKDSAKISQYSAYASALLNSGTGVFLELGGRWNNHSMYGNNFTYSLNPSYAKGRWKIFANLSTAFKAPTLYQLYDPNSGLATLKPEKSTSMEAGIQFTALEKAWVSRLVAFTRKLKDGIDYSLIDYRYFNNNSARDKGIELESQYRKNKWNLVLNYTYVTGEVNTVKYIYDAPSFSYVADGDTTYNYMFRRPAHSLNLTAGYQVTEKFYASVHGRYAGKRFEPRFMQAPLEVDAYTVFDLYGEYRFSQKIRAFADLRNIFNAKYTDVMGFSTRPINVMAGVSVGL